MLERSRQDVAGMTRGWAYHTAMVRKYRHAARYPWLPVEPDPPNPLFEDNPLSTH